MKNNRKNRKRIVINYKYFYLGNFHPVRHFKKFLINLNSVIKNSKHNIASIIYADTYVEIIFKQKNYFSIKIFIDKVICQKCAEDGIEKNPFTMCTNCAAEFENDFQFDIMAATNDLQNKK